jgi:thymidylate synthase
MIENKFKTAKEAFEFFYPTIQGQGKDFAGTKALFNIGFTIEKPMDRLIDTWYREWNHTYAEAEWQWYLTGEPTAQTLGKLYGKIPKIWQDMTDGNGKVNSNYGAQWERGWQLDKVVAMLKNNPDTRQAAVSIYDGKEISTYKYDTPCTYAVQFTVVDGKLNMCVTMRSNDLWFGFCNDQYCFSQLQEMVSKRTGYDMGTYYHFAHNLHIYKDQLNRDK